ncbi:MAG: LacI family DNA-binding transcriptional regulator, partial [Pseudomonadota bacterium]
MAQSSVTLKEISRRAKTSEATVSLVLNGKQFKRVSPATRSRIEQIAAEMGYRPNRQAQTLAHGRSWHVAVVVNSISNPFFGRYLAEVQKRLAEKGYGVMPRLGVAATLA